MADHAAPTPLTVALVLGSDQVEAIARRVAELLRPEPSAAAASGASPSPLVTHAEAAAFLRRPRQDVYDSILKGRFTARGTRARPLLLRAEIEAHAEGVDSPARDGTPAEAGSPREHALPRSLPLPRSVSAPKGLRPKTVTAGTSRDGP